jgi:prepilin-type N-terminal cleavage/methylation domain-containing protein
MKRNARLDNKGFTLVEMVIALTLLLLVSMAMMQTALVGIGANMQTVLRDEAIRIAEARMNAARSLQFDDSGDQLLSDTDDTIADEGFQIAACEAPPVSDPNTYPVVMYGKFGNLRPDPTHPERSGIRFGTRRDVRPLDGDHKQVYILVRWEYKNICYSHQVDALIKRHEGT